MTDQPDGADICHDIYGDRVALVPYIMPGFDLAQSCARIWEKHPDVEGLILLKHGIFTFGEDAREAYERMIDLVTVAEKRLARAKPAKSFSKSRIHPGQPARKISRPFCVARLRMRPAATGGGW